MTEIEPQLLSLPDPPRHNRRLAWTAMVSALLHATILGLLLLPSIDALPAPAEPIVVEVVTPQQMSSLDVSAPSAASSSAESSFAADSSAAAGQSSEASAMSEATSSESSEPVSSAVPSSAADQSQAASQQPSSEQPSAPAGRATLPVGPDELSSEERPTDEASSEASSSAAAETALTAQGEAGGADPLAQTMKPVGGGVLHAARRFYLKEMLSAPALAKAKAALGRLPHDRRLAQTCNIEATGQVGHSGGRYQPDALIANAFAAPTITGNSYSVSGGIFRSGERWYRIAYQCGLSDDLGRVTSFSFHIGDDVTAEVTAGRAQSGALAP